MKSEEKFNVRRLTTPITIFAAFWVLAIVMQLMGDGWSYSIDFGYIGTSVGVGMGLYMVLPPKNKERGRKLAQLLVGCYMLGLLGFMSQENMQIGLADLRFSATAQARHNECFSLVFWPKE